MQKVIVLSGSGVDFVDIDVAVYRNWREVKVKSNNYMELLNNSL